MSELNEIPVVEIDQNGNVTGVNQAFETALGWSREDIMGQSLSVIVPDHLRAAHAMGFARFMATEQPKIIGRPMQLPTLHKSGRIFQAEHTISAEKSAGQWTLKATIKPLS